MSRKPGKGRNAPKPEGAGGLVPRLRFPEFREAGKWGASSLAEICQILNNRRKPITESDRIKGPYPYYGASGIVDFVNDYIFDERLLLIGEDGAKWGAFERTAFIAEGKYWVNNHAHVLKPHDGIVDALLESYLMMMDLSPFITGAAPPKLTLGKLKEVPIMLPNTINEQQKIADCLSSLDDRIRLETERLNALKDHKKGLMQRMFPAEGETVPRLRFAEFRGAGEWSKTEIGQIADVYRGKGIAKSDIAHGGKQLCIRYGELYTIYGEVIHDVLSATNVPTQELFLSKANDVIIPASGETKEDIATASCVMRDGIALGGDLNVIRSPLNGVFLSYYMNGALSNNIARVAQGDSVVHLYPSQLKVLEISFPLRHEQQKIADCLSSLDDRIRLETERLNALKDHKKGLMQQIFPALHDMAI